MQRRDFLKSTVAITVAAELGMGKAQGMVPAHNWGRYDFGSGPTVTKQEPRAAHGAMACSAGRICPRMVTGGGSTACRLNNDAA